MKLILVMEREDAWLRIAEIDEEQKSDTHTHTEKPKNDRIDMSNAIVALERVAEFEKMNPDECWPKTNKNWKKKWKTVKWSGDVARIIRSNGQFEMIGQE